MFKLKYSLTIVFLSLYIFLYAQENNYSKIGFRFGLGAESMLDENLETEEQLNSVVLYTGFQIRGLDGRLRIIPSFDISYSNFEIDQTNSFDIVSTGLSLSANYDVFRKNTSSFYIGGGVGYKAQHLFLKFCPEDMDCVLTRLGGVASGSFNIDMGYRYESAESKLAYEILGRFTAGELAQFAQIVFLIDLKLR